MKVSDFDYVLPAELIAQRPTDKRDESRLLVLERDSGNISHEHFFDIKKYFSPGDVLVLNESKVLPARIFGIKDGTGAKIEFLLTKRIDGDAWETMVRPGKRLQKGDSVTFGSENQLKAYVQGYGDDGTRIVRFSYNGEFMENLEKIGVMPLPPYIDRASSAEDRERYQTVYAKNEGSVAAPTAGLHFTNELLDEIKKMGVEIVRIDLKVGIGTFRPVKTENIEDHHMHFEEYEVSAAAANAINVAKKEGRRIIACGTTSTRTLESVARKIDAPHQPDSEPTWQIEAGTGSTDIFIYPGYEFKIVDALITNFHLPKSTLMMLISAFYDREKILSVYEEAVRERYRFFSYGDAMFII